MKYLKIFLVFTVFFVALEVFAGGYHHSPVAYDHVHHYPVCSYPGCEVPCSYQMHHCPYIPQVNYLFDHVHYQPICNHPGCVLPCRLRSHVCPLLNRVVYPVIPQWHLLQLAALKVQACNNQYRTCLYRHWPYTAYAALPCANQYFVCMNYTY